MTTTETPTDRVEEIKARLLAGETYRGVGEAFGITHERVRQLVKKDDPHFLEKVARAREKRRKEATERVAKERHKALQAKRGKCRICGAQIPAERPAKYTCKPEHQQIWNKIRFHIDPELREKHRRSQAKAVLDSESPETYTDAQVAWARSVLSDDPPPLKPPTFTNDKTGEVRRIYEQWKRDFPKVAKAAGL